MVCHRTADPRPLVLGRRAPRSVLGGSLEDGAWCVAHFGAHEVPAVVSARRFREGLHIHDKGGEVVSESRHHSPILYLLFRRFLSANPDLALIHLPPPLLSYLVLVTSFPLPFLPPPLLPVHPPPLRPPSPSPPRPHCPFASLPNLPPPFAAARKLLCATGITAPCCDVAATSVGSTARAILSPLVSHSAGLGGRTPAAVPAVSSAVVPGPSSAVSPATFAAASAPA